MADRSQEQFYPAQRKMYARVSSHEASTYELSGTELFTSNYGASMASTVSGDLHASSTHSTTPLASEYGINQVQPAASGTWYRQNPWTTIRSWGARLKHWQRTNPYYGWRLGVLSGLIISIIVLFTNIILLIVGMTKSEGYADGIATLHKGSATRIGKLSPTYHVLINILSTLLLSASNYTMQVLCSPTRQEIDRAHAKGRFLNVGILSSRNVRYISKRRLLLWLTLATSSVPLHLFYNAAIFKVTTGNDFLVNFVSETSVDRLSELNQTMRNMSNSVWLRTYEPQYVSEFNDLYLIVDQISFGMNYLTAQAGSLRGDITSLPDPVNLTSGANSLSKSLIMAQGDWYVPFWYAQNGSTGRFKYQMDINCTYDLNHTYHIQYAFANPVKDVNDTSKVQISLVFMIVVIICNITKAFALFLTFKDTNTSFLVTQGDALASFLARPDSTTIACCLTSIYEIEDRIRLLRQSNETGEPSSVFDGEIWRRSRAPFQDGVTILRSTMTYGFAVAIIMICSFVFGFYGINLIGWGPASSQVIATAGDQFKTTDILLMAVIANAPQLGLSMVYITTNGVLTCVTMALEWNTWAKDRKGLRVTRPEGSQRSTHFLQLPYKIAIPLTITSGVLHWLLSETLFLVRIDIIDRNGSRLSGDSISACGYSSLSFLTFSIVALILFVTTAIYTLRSLVQEIPFAAANSLVLSAACHPPEGDVDAHLKEIQWGALHTFGIDDEHTVGHCTFSSGEVKPPIEGKRYL